jgi:hypothetical protein
MYREPWKALILEVVKINSDPVIDNQIKNMGLEYLLEIMSIGNRLICVLPSHRLWNRWCVVEALAALISCCGS